MPVLSGGRSKPDGDGDEEYRLYNDCGEAVQEEHSCFPGCSNNHFTYSSEIQNAKAKIPSVDYPECGKWKHPGVKAPDSSVEVGRNVALCTNMLLP